MGKLRNSHTTPGKLYDGWMKHLGTRRKKCLQESLLSPPLMILKRIADFCVAMPWCCCTKYPLLTLFTMFLNICPHRPCKKPLTPSCSVQLSDTKDSPMPIPLLAAALGADTQTVLLAYGAHLQPVMERVVSVGQTVENSLGYKTSSFPFL